MQLAITAKTTADNVRSSLSYINTLVTNAANNGYKYIVVDGTYMDDTMADYLTSIGYNVTLSYFDMGTFPRYLISFDSPGSTIEEFHLLNEYGGILMTETSNNINKE